MSIKDCIEIGVWLVQIIGISYAIFQYQTSKKQFNFEIITSCTTRFQEILDLIDSSEEKQKIRGYKKYIDLCNEEIFYFQQEYIPDDVVKEWLDGMMVFIPHYDRDKKKVKSNEIHERIIDDNKLLENYPRIEDIFTVDRIYDIRNPTEKKKLVEELFRNIKKK